MLTHPKYVCKPIEMIFWMNVDEMFKFDHKSFHQFPFYLYKMVYVTKKFRFQKGTKYVFYAQIQCQKIYCISNLRPLEPHFICFLLILPTIFSSILYSVHNKIFVFITKPTKYKLVVHQNPFEMLGHACLMTC